VADDLHLVGEPGAILEVVMSRMRMISMECQFRIVGLSLSVADYKEMAEWLGARHVFNFAPTTRCNNIQISISSYDNSNRPLRVQMMVR
jgi:pre-mRNA-splicing helicase BRR2